MYVCVYLDRNCKWYEIQKKNGVLTSSFFLIETCKNKNIKASIISHKKTEWIKEQIN